MTEDRGIKSPSKRAALAGAATAIVALVWVFTLPRSSSLWLDELLSAWVSSGSFEDALQRAWHYQGQSPLYFTLLWAVRRGLGSSESALRSLSLISGLLSLSLLFALCRRWWGVLPACIAVAAILLVDEFSVAALSARPYSLALLALLCSLWSAEKWVESRRPSWLFAAALCGLVTFYAHYLFLFALMLPGARVWATHRAIDRAGAAAGLLLGAGMLPGFYQLALLREKEDLYAFAASPTIGRLVQLAVPMPILLAVVFAAVIVAVFKGRTALRTRQGDSASAAPSMAVTVCWWILPIVVFFCLSNISSNSLFLPRLFLWAYLGLAFTLAAAASRFLRFTSLFGLRF